jgi:hypothetical protein
MFSDQINEGTEEHNFNVVVAEPEVSTHLIPKLANRQDPEPDQSTFHLDNLL